ncbi:MAG: PD-(D/E)XK nuclease family protein [Bacillota bacterium]|jgi:ATP-dependent helicase/nuclease subunit B
MGLQFIIGPAGSGKTKYIIDSVIERLLSQTREIGKDPILIIVPDQATFQMERAILEDGRLAGFINLHILGFRRLCLRVLDEVGGAVQPFITPVGRSMAIQSILWRHRSDLKVYAPMVDYPGFRDTVIQALSEFNAYGIQPDDLLLGFGQESENPPFLSQKLADLELVYREYREFLSNRFLDPDDYLELAALRMGQSSLMRNASVWIDGFSGFTPREYQVIEAILNSVSEVTLALCMDRGEIQHKPRETSLFHPVREVYERVSEICLESGIPVNRTVFLGENGPLPRFNSHELMQVEFEFRNRESRGRLANTPGQAQKGQARENDCGGTVYTDPGGVHLVSAVNPRAEVEFIARETLALVREQGMRFKDITVELRNIERYKDLVKMVFGDHNIPFFLDEKRSLSHHPLAELIRSAFDMVLTHFGFDSVFRYLKTDLIPVKRELVDKLENYVLASGIRGERWILPEPWRYTGGFLSDNLEGTVSVEACGDEMDLFRKQAMASFSRFYEELTQNHNGHTAKDISMAVYNLLMNLDVPKTLSRWQKDCENQGDLIGALDHGGVWDKVIEILEQAVEILGDHPCSLKTYSLLLNAGLEDLKLGSIPPSLDQVLVGSLDRTRQPECRVTFLMGALEGDLPRKQGEEGIFTDRDREALFNKGLNLEPSSRIKQFHEQYLVYIALTRPKERLYISYPLGDQEGKALFPSPVVTWVKKIMPGKGEYLVSMEPPGTYPGDLDYLVPATVWGLTARRLSLMRQRMAPGIVWQEAYRWLLSPPREAKSRKILGSLGYSNKMPQLGKPLSERLYGRVLRTSVSRLERFEQCPFQHFARDGLGLKEREIFKLDPAKTGTFFHEAMREFVLRVAGSGQPVEALEQEDVARIMDGVVQGLAPRIQNDLFLSSSRYMHVSSALGSILRRSARLFLEHAKRSEFRPLAVEVPFGLPGGVPPFSVKASDGSEVLIRGRIDRIDAAQLGSQTYLRIVDYKSNPDKLDLLEVYHGLSLQLLVYLAAVLSEWGSIIDSPFYLHNSGVLQPSSSGHKTGSIPQEPQMASAKANVLPAGAVYQAIQDPFVRADGPIDKDTAWHELKKKLKMTGALVDNVDVLRLMDGTSPAHSDILHVRFTKSGVSSAQALPVDDMQALLAYVIEKIKDISAQIRTGRIDIAPFRRDQKRACTYCPFGPICTFDVLVDGNEYRLLKNIPKEAIWEEIVKYCARGE